MSAGDKTNKVKAFLFLPSSLISEISFAIVWLAEFRSITLDLHWFHKKFGIKYFVHVAEWLVLWICILRVADSSPDEGIFLFVGCFSLRRDAFSVVWGICEKNEGSP